MQLYTNSVQDRFGNALKGAQITVRTSVGAFAVIYSDNGVTMASNPLTADATGEFAFYAANGRYTFTVTASGMQAEIVSAFEMQDALELQTAVTVGAVQVAADRVQTALDRVATGQDKVATAADRVITTQDKTATAFNVVQSQDASLAAQMGVLATLGHSTSAALSEFEAGESERRVNEAIATYPLAASLGVNLAAADGVLLVGNAADKRVLSGSGGAGLVGTLAAGTGAVSRTVQSKLRESVSVKDFGAVGDGVADDTSAIQSAFNSGNKKIVCDRGYTFRITATLVVNSDNLTVDFSGSTIRLDDASGLLGHIKIGDGITQRNGNQLKDITFTRAQIATASAAVVCDFVGVLKISGLRIFGENKIFNGVHVKRGIIVDMEKNYIQACRNIGIYLEGTGLSGNRTVDVNIRESRIEGGVNAINSYDFVEGLSIRDNVFYGISNTGVVASAASNGNGLVSFKFQDNDFDTCGGRGLYIDNISNIQITGNWFSSNTQQNIELASNTGAALISGNQVYGSTANSIELAGSDARVSDNIISGGASAIYVKATALRTSIEGNSLGNCGYGVNCAENPVGVNIVSNHFHGNSSGTIADAASPNARYVANNSGIASSSSFIALGASPFTYRTGPRPEYISIFSGTVSNITTGGNSLAFSSERMIVLPPQTEITVTYSVVPIMLKVLL